MIQPVFNTMIYMLLAKFMLNDMPHAAGLFNPTSSNPDYEREPTPGQLRYITVLCSRLKITVHYEEQVRTFGEAGRMIRELEEEERYRKKLKGSNPAQVGTCYEDAWRFLIKGEEGFLVHGSVQLSEGGPIVGHAWVELPAGWVWEPQMDKGYSLETFRQLLSPVEEHRYTVEEAAIMAARTGNLGPWAAEERMRWLRR